MHYIQTRSLLKIEGFVDIKVYDKYDIKQMEPKVDIFDKNATQSELMEKIVDEMFSSSGDTDYHLTTSTNWFTSNIPGSTSHPTTTPSQNAKDGIFVRGNRATSTIWCGDPYETNVTNDLKDLLLSDSTSTTYSSNTNHCTWAAQATWNAASSDDYGTGNVLDNTISHLEIGKNYFVQGDDGQGVGTTNGFVTPFAIDTPSSFILQEDDIIKITWKITIG